VRTCHANFSAAQRETPQLRADGYRRAPSGKNNHKNIRPLITAGL